MRLIVGFAAVIGIVLGTLGVARSEAATPTPSPTASAAATPEPPMVVNGDTWVDARPGGEDVHALIGGVECASAPQFLDQGPTFTLTIPAASVRAGCGVPGATITFLIGNRPASNTLVWRAGATVQNERLIAGPPFTLYVGTFTYTGADFAGIEVEPLIDGVVCGIQVGPTLGLGPTWPFVVVVDPEALHPGCGKPGAVVTFRLVRNTGTTRIPLYDAWFTDVRGPGGILVAEPNFVPNSAAASALPPLGAGPPQSAFGSAWYVVLCAGLLGLTLLLGGLRFFGAGRR